MKLTKENPISHEFAFEGLMNVLVVGGVGTIRLERKLGNSDFYPLTGYPDFELNNACAYNGSLENKGVGVSFRWNADISSGEVEIVHSRVVRCL